MTAAPALADALRQMLAALEAERQALAALDIDALSLALGTKQQLCCALEGTLPADLDAECQSLAQAARMTNEINRRVRNLVAANVVARLDALTGSNGLYRSSPASGRCTGVRV